MDFPALSFPCPIFSHFASSRLTHDSIQLSLFMSKREQESGHEQLSKKPKLITEFFAQVNQKPKLSKKPVASQKPLTKVAEKKVQQMENITTITHVHSSKDESTKKVQETSISKPVVATTSIAQDEYDDFCQKFNFNKKEWVASLTEEERQLLALEVNTLHITWLAFLHKELTKPYFLKLKRFLKAQAGKTVFPPPGHIYSWSHYTPLPEVKCLILGQDPYHNFNQAHGLAFLVLEPTRPPPSLINIYKTLKIDFPSFEIPDYNSLNKQGRPGGGNLTKWAKRGVLMLNACLTVEAHKANSHAGQGWEQFTEQVIKTAILYAQKENHQGFVIMAWGTPAQKRVAKFGTQLSSPETPFLVLKTVHPSPLSANRGFFDLKVFKKCNEWLVQNGKQPIDWGIIDGNSVTA